MKRLNYRVMLCILGALILAVAVIVPASAYKPVIVRTKRKFRP